MRDDLLRQPGLLTDAACRAFDEEYRCVRLGDALSLQWCNGWPGPEETLGYRATFGDNVLQIAPDPFGGAAVALRLLGRRIPARPYRHDADLREALAAVAPVVVSGEAKGA
ncbi:MAG: hypothetical protein HYY76_21055 [Acidobacteria bacterium]|nr:hypothetical protein [Acidobacteriota bacterium]